MNKVIDKDYTKNLKINNVWEAVIHSQDYKNKYDSCDDVFTLQKEVFKNYVLPRIQEIINNFIAENEEYKEIKIIECNGKYTKNDKYINITLYYDDDKEIIITAKNYLNKLKNDLNWMLFQNYSLDIL